MNHSPLVAHTAVQQQKPIRFVTNNDGPYAKRRRINSACTTCRRRKTRCSGERPVCGTCTQNKHECGGYGNEPEVITGQSDAQEIDNKTGAKRALQQAEANNDPPRPHTSRKNDLKETDLREHPGLRKTFSMDSAASSSPTMLGLERRSPTDTKDGLSLSTRNRMPYFRYFGPTAIMPGFKQMVVKVRGKQQGAGASNSDYIDSPSAKPVSLAGGTPSQQGPDEPAPVEIPVYDTSAVAPPPLITQLCKTFFTHLGCNFPFLQQERFMRDLEEKQVDSILVDAVCAMAARFSTDPTLTGKASNATDSEKPAIDPEVHASDHGAAFAQRAKSAIADTFACPSVAVVQAALLLAYDEFGGSRDSGLWMYLGIAIRMAQDLGMQTLEGLRYEGRNGPTPQSVKNLPSRTLPQSRRSNSPLGAEGENAKEQKAVERERIDTFWAVFFLDRVISSGTGRPVTLRDRDIEISFPSLDEVDPATNWPAPFSALIRVIHLYGRVTDLLNGIKEVQHVTPDVIKKLASMEAQLTEIYQGLSSKLHFNAINFQHYVKAGQGTNFILLHIWFHTLIVLLHQPTLLKTFEGQIQQLLPNSRELSMSSAKTIADMLAFAELIDSKAALGNPFTSQPIYIAACAFLKETALLTASSNPQSRLGTPPLEDPEAFTSARAALESASNPQMTTAMDTSSDKDGATADQKQAAKHTLLAAAANQNYQRCYRGLKSLETYWAGTKYILTVLDQKAKGVADPLLYTREEMESALEVPRPEPAFTSPGWRRKLSWGTYLTAQGIGDVSALRNRHGPQAMKDVIPPMMDPSQAIGWSLTGTMNSPNTSLAVLYSTDNQPPSARRKQDQEKQTPTTSDRGKGRGTTISPHLSAIPPRNFDSPTLSDMPPPPSATHFQRPMPNDPAVMSDADLLLNLHSPYSNSPSQNISNPNNVSYMTHQHTQPPRGLSSGDYSSGQQGIQQYNPLGAGNHGMNYGEMMIQSQDIDLSTLGDEVMPWFDYLPPELMGMYDQNGVQHQFPQSSPGADPSRNG